MAYSDFVGLSISSLAGITDNVTESNEAYWESTSKAYGQIRDIISELGSNPSGGSADLTTRLDPSNYISEILTVDGAGSGLDADLLDGYDSTAIGILAEDDSITGQWTFVQGANSSPFLVSGSGVVSSLNADQVDGRHASYFAAVSEGEEITGAWKFRTLVKIEVAGEQLRIGESATDYIKFYHEATTSEMLILTSARTLGHVLTGVRLAYNGSIYSDLYTDSAGKFWCESTANEYYFTYSVTEYIKMSVDSGGTTTLMTTGDLVFDPDGFDVLPNTSYEINLGSLTKKYLSLYAAELVVETLVAQNTIATVGGRILVGPTTTLIADVAAIDTTIDVKHNEMASGDIVYLESDGKVEFMSIDSTPTTITGGYRYTVTRDLDSSGANIWYQGDAVFNTGTTGDGFIDLYSFSGVLSGSGPTIAVNRRNSATYSDISTHVAFGNLNELYGYASDAYGMGIGDYGYNHLVVDDTNGIRFRNASGANTLGQWNGSVVTIGDTTARNVYIDGTSLEIRDGGTTYAKLTTAQLRLGNLGDAHVILNSTDLEMYDAGGTQRISIDSSGNIGIGDLGASTDTNIQINGSELKLRYQATTRFLLDSTGITLGQASTASQNSIRVEGQSITMRQNASDVTRVKLDSSLNKFTFHDASGNEVSKMGIGLFTSDNGLLSDGFGVNTGYSSTTNAAMYLQADRSAIIRLHGALTAGTPSQSDAVIQFGLGAAYTEYASIRVDNDDSDKFKVQSSDGQLVFNQDGTLNFDGIDEFIINAPVPYLTLFEDNSSKAWSFVKEASNNDAYFFPSTNGSLRIKNATESVDVIRFETNVSAIGGPATYVEAGFIGTPSSTYSFNDLEEIGVEQSSDTANLVIRVKGNAAAVTLGNASVSPAISDGIDGQIIIIVGADNTNTVTIPDEANQASSNVFLGGTDVTLGLADVLTLMFDSTKGGWIKIAHSNN